MQGKLVEAVKCPPFKRGAAGKIDQDQLLEVAKG